jgi:hypothetical protein
MCCQPIGARWASRASRIISLPQLDRTIAQPAEAVEADSAGESVVRFANSPSGPSNMHAMRDLSLPRIRKSPDHGLNTLGNPGIQNEFRFGKLRRIRHE